MHSFSACSRLTGKKEVNAYASFYSVSEGEILEVVSVLFSLQNGTWGFLKLNVSERPPLQWRAPVSRETAM